MTLAKCADGRDSCSGLRAGSLVVFLIGTLLTSSYIAMVQAQKANDGQTTTHMDNFLIELNEDNWERMLSGEWMVEFFAPWCPACKNLAPTWQRFAKAATDLEVKVAKIDVTTSPSLSGRFFVTALPTIYHVKNGEFRQYRGSRDGDALMLFLKQKQWQKIEPISAWKKPDTIHMSILSYFFKLSHTLKDFNLRLQEEYGLPTWGSYALFAIGTIFVGAALGLLLVCVVDFLYPPKKTQRQSFSESKDKAGSDAIEDLANDEIEDENEENEENIENDENEDDEIAEDNEDVEEADLGDTSEGEKNSNSESEEPESEKDVKKSDNDAQKMVNDDNKTKESSSPTEVRKRKPRKAD